MSLENFKQIVLARIAQYQQEKLEELETERKAMRIQEEAKAKAKVEEEQRQAAEKLKAEQDAIDATAKTSARTKCDGECWNTDTAPVAKPAAKNGDVVVFNDLYVGDRFIAYEALWTKIDTDIARKHSEDSMNLGERGYGYRLDSICSFDNDDEVRFVPPPVNVREASMKVATPGYKRN